MKIKDGFKLRKVGGEFIISGEGLSQINFNKLIALNVSATYLWQKVEGSIFDEETLAQLLVSKYGISKEDALKDSSDIIKSWLDVGIIEE